MVVAAGVAGRMRSMEVSYQIFANISFSCSVSQSLTSHVLLKLSGLAE
jgi:hypothetical protein